MDWKDTVKIMSQHCNIYCHKDQAEISFKAGYDQRESEFVYNPDYLDFQKGVEAGRITGKRAGIREAGLSFKAGYKYAQDVGMEEAYEFVKREGVKEVVEAIYNELTALIIGVNGCDFDQRLDDDKGCIVLDMNMNQWRKFWEER